MAWLHDAIARAQSGAALIAAALDDAGYLRSQPVPMAAHRLADWMVKLTPAQLDRLNSALRPFCAPERMQRILCGALIPDRVEARRIALISVGHVLPEQWEELGPELPEDAPEPVGAPAMAGARGASMMAPMVARVPVDWRAIFAEPVGGPPPGGPLFGAYCDEAIRGGFVLSGLGLALRLDLAGARAMREALDIGIAFLDAADGARRAA